MSGRSGSRDGSSRTALVVALPVACGAGLLLVVGALAFVVMRRRAAVPPAVEVPRVCVVGCNDGDEFAAPIEDAAQSPVPNPLCSSLSRHSFPQNTPHKRKVEGRISPFLHANVSQPFFSLPLLLLLLFCVLYVVSLP